MALHRMSTSSCIKSGYIYIYIYIYILCGNFTVAGLYVTTAALQNKFCDYLSINFVDAGCPLNTLIEVVALPQLHIYTPGIT